MWLSQLYCYNANIRYISNALTINASCCPKCPSIKKEGYYILPTLHEASRKKKKQEVSRKFTRSTKTQTIIHKLSVPPVSGHHLMHLPKILIWKMYPVNSINYITTLLILPNKSGSSVLLFLIWKSSIRATRYTFAKQSATNSSYKAIQITKLNVNKSIVRKRTDTAGKFYDIFSAMGEDKIRRIKSFTASSFSDLTRSTS